MGIASSKLCIGLRRHDVFQRFFMKISSILNEWAKSNYKNKALPGDIVLISLPYGIQNTIVGLGIVMYNQTEGDFTVVRSWSFGVNDDFVIRPSEFVNLSSQKRP